MEMLREAFLNRAESPSKNVVDEERFESLIPTIQRCVGDTLSSANIRKPDIDAICNKNKLLGLNRRSFGSAHRNLCKEVRLKAGNEINLFIACRDSLVHRGDFYCNTANEEQRNECSPLPSPVDEFFFLINFLDKIFLKLFDYKGQYINWRSSGNPSKEQL